MRGVEDMVVMAESIAYVVEYGCLKILVCLEDILLRRVSIEILNQKNLMMVRRFKNLLWIVRICLQHARNI